MFKIFVFVVLAAIVEISQGNICDMLFVHQTDHRTEL